MPSRPRGALAAVAALATVAGLVAAAPPSSASAEGLVINEVYGGGGGTDPAYAQDFVELYNPTGSPVSVDGWSVQYASANGTGWQSAWLHGTVAAGAHHLVGLAGGATGAALPTPDDSFTLAMSASSGRVALVSSRTALACGTSCVGAPGVVDYVGYGSVAEAEGGHPAPALDKTVSDQRSPEGKDSDDNAADLAKGVPSPTNAAGETSGTPSGPGTPLTVPQIQGAAQTSPHVGERVTTTGVVTGYDRNGVWVQDPAGDGDDRTSDAVYVVVSGASQPRKGDAVEVTGTVAEWRPGGSSNANLTTTEITKPSITVTASGQSLPAPVVVGEGGRRPPTTVVEDDADGQVTDQAAYDPDSDGIDFWESMEGMRVEIARAVVVGPLNKYGEAFVVPDGAASVRTARGGIVVRDLPGETVGDYRSGDFNPERVMIDSAFTTLPSVDVGDRFDSALTGILDYNFSNFDLHVDHRVTRVAGGIAPETTRATTGDELSVATFNVENLDPTDPQEKFDRLAHQVVDNLAAPDVVAVEEIQDDTGAECPDGPSSTCRPDGVVTAGRTLAAFTDAIRRAGGPAYEWRSIDPENLADGGEPTGNIRVAFLFRPDRVDFVDRPGGTATTGTQVVQAGPRDDPRGVLTYSPGRIDPTDPAWEDSRKPLAGEFRFRGRTVIVVANHWASKGGDQPVFGRYQPPARSSETQRVAQAKVVAQWVHDALEVDPRANIVVAGDLNDYDFSPAVHELTGTGMVDLPATLPLPERYTYVYEGNSQVLDHILVSPYLGAGRYDYDVVHVNAELADQASDHDPQVVRLTLRR